MKCYLLAITLHYGYQYSSAIKLYIEQADQSIAEKKKSSSCGCNRYGKSGSSWGAIANNSKSFTGTFIGYSSISWVE
ncbi:MAG: hypothetical protein IPO85_11880 [Saprospiraceae bacterium]|uniref:Uncharacterized protein n=1 Tax=Candidatus Defluviibacterium haderslevense TaxID=2981993 RepID=A0A9D7S9E1_9BACT|nr:hypothetical protein [Candidatus Defluviibacterium haderslevense]